MKSILRVKPCELYWYVFGNLRACVWELKNNVSSGRVKNEMNFILPRRDVGRMCRSRCR